MLKKLNLLSAVIIMTVQLSGQDMFPIRRLTFDPAQQGFATWSPDSKYIVYQFTDMNDTLGKNGLWRVAADGTGAKQIFRGLAEHPKWSPDGKYIVFDADTGKSIRMIPAGGGEIIKFLPDSVMIQNGGLPCWSPDGSRIAFLERRGSSVCIWNFKTRELKSLFRQEGYLPLPGGWLPDGNNILIANMERKTRKCTMLKVSSENGEIKTIPGHKENFYRHTAPSPDGSLLIYAALEGKYLGLYIMPLEGGRSLPLAVTKDCHTEGAAWSPDGKKIAFTRTEGRNFDIWIMEINIKRIKRDLNK